MPHYDESTRLFMEKMADGPSPHQHKHKDEGPTAKEYVKNTKTLLNILNNPVKAIPRAVLKGALNVGFKKESGMRPVALFSFLNDQHDHLWWDWEPETIRQTLEQEHAIEPTREVMNMIGALQLVALSNGPFEHWHQFEKVGHAFYQNIVDFRVVQPLEPDEAAAAFKYLALIRPGQEFEDEIYAYVAAACHMAGMVYLPDDLFPAPCQTHLEGMIHDTTMTAEVKGCWGSGVTPGSEAIVHQVAMLHDVKEALSDA